MKQIWLFLTSCMVSLCAVAQLGGHGSDYAPLDETSTRSFLPTSIQEKLALLDGVDIAYTGKRQGVIKAVDASGAVVFEAGYKQRKPHGVWRSATESGWFDQGVPDGRWSFYDASGSVRAIRDYNAAKWHLAEHAYKYYNPKRGNMVPVSKAVQQGVRLNQLLQQQTGLEPFIPPFQGGMLHGTRINYFANGMVSDSCAYSMGLRHGDFVAYDTLGVKREHGYFHHGDAHGGWTRFNAAGEIMELVTYQHGKVVHRKVYETGRP